MCLWLDGTEGTWTSCVIHSLAFPETVAWCLWDTSHVMSHLISPATSRSSLSSESIITLSRAGCIKVFQAHQIKSHSCMHASGLSLALENKLSPHRTRDYICIYMKCTRCKWQIEEAMVSGIQSSKLRSLAFTEKGCGIFNRAVSQ